MKPGLKYFSKRNLRSSPFFVLGKSQRRYLCSIKHCTAPMSRKKRDDCYVLYPSRRPLLMMYLVIPLQPRERHRRTNYPRGSPISLATNLFIDFASRVSGTGLGFPSSLTLETSVECLANFALTEPSGRIWIGVAFKKTFHHTELKAFQITVFGPVKNCQPKTPDLKRGDKILVLNNLLFPNADLQDQNTGCPALI